MSDAPRLRLGQLWRLSWHDLWHERWLAACSACLLAAMLSPLWTLWGLERGVIGTLIERQDRDPLMRQMQPAATGNNRFDAAWFARVRAWPGVDFVIPTVRSAAALVELFSDSADAPVTADLRATASNDPLLGGLKPPTGATLVLSAETARRLKVSVGESLIIPLRRQREGVGENATIGITVAGVLSLSASDGVNALAPAPLLDAIESWRDGYTVPGVGEGGAGPAPPRVVYPSFRLYAVSIHQVADIAARLEAEGVTTTTREREIEGMLGLQRNLQGVLTLVAAVTLSGAMVALLALQAATLRRKRHEHALLKLVGYGRAWLMSLPCMQAALVALIGGVLALGLYSMGAGAINAYFASHFLSGEAAVHLNPADVLLGFAAALLISILPALWGGWRASNVEAADELRDQ